MIASGSPRTVPPLLVVLSLLVGGGGCASSVAEHDEVSHALPPHHPRSFPRAVAALAAGRLHRTERLDVLRWLPDLAADTTLGRADWDRVVAIAARLTTVAAAGGDDGTIAGGVAELRDIVAALPPEERRDGDDGGDDESGASPAAGDASGEAAS